MMPITNAPYTPQKHGHDPYGLGQLRDLARRVIPGATVEYDTTPLLDRRKPLRIWYDTEFVEDGRTIDPLSIGMISEDGRVLYRVNDDQQTMSRAVQRDWLRENVVKHLPVKVWSVNHAPGWQWIWDLEHPHADAVRTREQIREDVQHFIEESLKLEGYDGVRLWAWYGAYDHVAYAQLFGRMIDLPEGFPMWTNDLKQEVDRLGNPKLPDLSSPDREHDALADALELRHRHLWLERRAV
jgi:hypothetical protein